MSDWQLRLLEVQEGGAKEWIDCIQLAKRDLQLSRGNVAIHTHSVFKWSAANWQNFSLRSIPAAGRPLLTAARRTVPLPANGSSTFPSGGHPISRHFRTSCSGK